MVWIKENLQGKIFSKLLVIERANKGSKWRCRCECGQEVIVRACHLLSGNNKSCGCLKKTILGNSIRTHGTSNSRITGYSNVTYGRWQAMRGRCMNPNNARWASYGGRGIKVCSRWNDYTLFLEDMGEVPKGLTLDRINVDGDYEPSNCRWATWAEQAQNKRAHYTTRTKDEAIL